MQKTKLKTIIKSTLLTVLPFLMFVSCSGKKDNSKGFSFFKNSDAEQAEEEEGISISSTQNLESELIAGQNPNQYSVKISWKLADDASLQGLMLRRYCNQSDETKEIKLAEQKNGSFLDSEVQSGMKYKYELMYQLDEANVSYNKSKSVFIPKDLVVDRPMLLSEINESFEIKNNQLNLKRIFLLKNGVLDIENNDLKIEVESFVAGGGTIGSFLINSTADENTNGKNGGELNLRIKNLVLSEIQGANNADAILNIKMRGQNGGQGLQGAKGRNGRNGKSGESSTIQENFDSCGPLNIVTMISKNINFRLCRSTCWNATDGERGENGGKGERGLKGKNGGDSSNLELHIENNKDKINVKAVSEAGSAGVGGRGGEGGSGGQGGSAGSRTCGPSAKNGANGNNGDSGESGENGEAGRSAKMLMNGLQVN